MTTRLRFRAPIYIVGINPLVDVPDRVLTALQRQSGIERGPIPVQGTLNGAPYRQTIVRYAGAWRLHLNGPMRQAAGIEAGDTASVTVEFDPTPRATPMPPLLLKAFSATPKARAAYDALSPSRQNEIRRYLASLKQEATIRRNVERVIAHLLGEDAPTLHALMRRPKPDA
ncbi:MAG: DUF1905 domain-containing protein [Chloroflexi bacterium]|nr:MAG: DUF1905 domain-containing protein [Chloroflexota bacterium]